jgi:uncharacterized protein
MEPQRVHADTQIKADLDAVALKYGPLIYNVETADRQNIAQQLGDGQLKAEWRPHLLEGTVVITGTWNDGSPMVAIANYARMNRVGPPAEYLGDTNVNYAPGATTSNGTVTPNRGANKDAPATPASVTAQTGSSDAGTNGTVNARRGSAVHVLSKVWV